jgi:hypothetical protein
VEDRMLKNARKVKPRLRSTNKWQEYEIRKKAIPVHYTPDQYEAACRQVARELGI